MAAGIGQWSLHSSNSYNYKKYHGRAPCCHAHAATGHEGRGARHRAAVCELLPSIRRATWGRAQRATGVEDNSQRARERERERERDDEFARENSPQTRNDLCQFPLLTLPGSRACRNLRVNITPLLSAIVCWSRVTCVEPRVKCQSGETDHLVAEVRQPSDRGT